METIQMSDFTVEISLDKQYLKIKLDEPGKTNTPWWEFDRHQGSIYSIDLTSEVHNDSNDIESLGKDLTELQDLGIPLKVGGFANDREIGVTVKIDLEDILKLQAETYFEDLGLNPKLVEDFLKRLYKLNQNKITPSEFVQLLEGKEVPWYDNFKGDINTLNNRVEDVTHNKRGEFNFSIFKLNDISPELLESRAQRINRVFLIFLGYLTYSYE